MRTSTLLLGLALVTLAVVHSTSAGCGCKKRAAPPPLKCGCGCGKVRALPKCGCSGKKGLVGGIIGGGLVGGVVGGVLGTATGAVKQVTGTVGGGCGCGGGGGVVSGVVSQAVKQPLAVVKSLTEVQVREKYARQPSETLQSYFERIISRSYDWVSTPDDYLRTLTLVWKDYPTLDLWWNKKYLDLSKQFFSLYYAKRDNEDWDVYYGRLTRREAWETDDCFAKRITVVRDCFPSLDLWTSQRWFDKYTKVLYATEFKRFAQESEVDYIKRIFEKDSYCDFTDDAWAKRVFLIQEATISSPLWYNENYLNYFSNFYKVYYKVQEKETPDAWLTKVLTPLPGENIDNALTRLKFIKSVTSDCGFWKKDYFKQIKTAKVLQDDWLVKVQSAFFPCGCGGGAVTIKTSSSAASAAASSAASSVSSATTIVQA